MTHEKQIVDEGLARRRFTRAGAFVWNKLKKTVHRFHRFHCSSFSPWAGI